MRYGDNNTIHHTGHVDVEIGPDGKVCAVWFRCATLPFEEHRVDEDRAKSMNRGYKEYPHNPIKAIDFEDPEEKADSIEELLSVAIARLEQTKDDFIGQLKQYIQDFTRGNDNEEITEEEAETLRKLAERKLDALKFHEVTEEELEDIPEVTDFTNAKRGTFMCDRGSCFEHHCCTCRQPLSQCECEDELDEVQPINPYKVTLSGKQPDLNYNGPAPQDIDPRTGMHKDYWVLSEEERKKGFVRPVRCNYVHKTCGAETIMALALAETYARNPKFYSGTFCAKCRQHFPVDQFYWPDDGSTLGD